MRLEAPLRSAAAGLRQSLQDLLEESREPAYRDIIGLLDRAVPELHSHYEAYVRAVISTGNTAITCSRGCGHCCSHYVTSVEPWEILYMDARIRGRPDYQNLLVAFHRRATLFSGLLAESGGREEEDKALYRYHLRATPCPFLSRQGVCGAYDIRPISCRMFFSLSNPLLCKGRATTSPANRNFIVELPEDIEADLNLASRMFSRFPISESMFEGLLDANGHFGQYDTGRDTTLPPLPAP